MNIMTKKDLINTIKTNKGNLAYIAETGKINGSLMTEIERVMDEWKALNIDSVVGQSEQLFCDCEKPNYRWVGEDDDMYEECFNCRKDKAK